MAVTLLNHALLSADAAALTPAALEAFAAAAGAVLGITGLDETDDRVVMAVAFEVNLLVDLDPGFGVVTSRTRGRQSVTLAQGAAPVAGQAIGILSGVEGWAGLPTGSRMLDPTSWRTLQSLRRAAVP